MVVIEPGTPPHHDMGLAALLGAINGWRSWTSAGCPSGVLGFGRDQRHRRARDSVETRSPGPSSSGSSRQGRDPWRHCLSAQMPKSVVDSTRPRELASEARACSWPMLRAICPTIPSNQAGMAPATKCHWGALHRHNGCSCWMCHAGGSIVRRTGHNNAATT